MTHAFSIGESIRWGWATLKSRSKLIYQVLLTLLALQVAYSIVMKVLAGTALGFVAAAVLLVAEIVVGIGATLVTLKLARGEHTSYSDILPSWTLLWHYLAANILVGCLVGLPIAFAVAIIRAQLATTIGSFNLHAMYVIAHADPALAPQMAREVLLQLSPLSIVVGIVALLLSVYLVLRYFFVKLLPLEGNGVIESLKKSAVLARGVKWRILLFLLVIIALNILGAAVILVGLLVSIPVTMLAYAHVYVQLSR